MAENKKASENRDFADNINNSIVAHSTGFDFVYSDWDKSGISRTTTNKYISKSYLKSTPDWWELIYSDLFENKKSDYWTKRLKNPIDGKYMRPKAKAPRFYRPLDLSPEVLSNPENYVVIVEGEKKAIKAVEAGINCVAIAGVWCFKSKKTKDGLMPDIHKIDWKNKVVYLCFDSDIQHKPSVKSALCALVELLQEFGAIVKNLDLTQLDDGNNLKIGLDDALKIFGEKVVFDLMKNAKTFDTLEMQAEMLLGGISSVNDAEDIKWVVQDLFAKGYVGFIFGEAGSKKTWLLIDMSINLSNGIDVFNGIEVEQSKVLLFEGDTPDPMIRERLKQLGGRLNDEYFQYVNRYTADQKGIDISLSSKKGRKYIEKCIETFRPDIVIFDTLISFIDADESKQDEMKKIVDALRKYAADYNCHILVCHHARKRESGEKRGKLDQSDLIGSSVLNRLASVILAVDKGEKEEQGVLRVNKSWFKPVDAVSFELVNMPENRIKITFEAHTEANTKAESMKNKIIEYIKTKSITELTRKELAEALGDESAVKRALKMLERDGYIQGGGNTKNRIYTVIPPEK